MNVAELKALLANIPGDYEVVYRDYEGSGLGGHPVYCSQSITDYGWIDTEKEFCLYAEKQEASDATD